MSLLFIYEFFSQSTESVWEKLMLSDTDNLE